VHEPIFCDAVRPAGRVCLRLPLRTYSIGHEILLWRQRNPLLTLTAAAFSSLPIEDQKSWLRKAVLICSNDWRGNFRRQRWLAVWRYFTEGCDYGWETLEFQMYLMEQRTLLKTLSAAVPLEAEAFEIANAGEKLAMGRPLGSPLAAQLLNFVMRRALHLALDDRGGWAKFWRPATIYDAPFAQSANLMLAELECEGRLHVENEREREEREHLVAANAEIDAQAGEMKSAWALAATDAERVAVICRHLNTLRFSQEIFDWAQEHGQEVEEHLRRSADYAD
jgi:hypothetical protein